MGSASSAISTQVRAVARRLSSLWMAIAPASTAHCEADPLRQLTSLLHGCLLSARLVRLLAIDTCRRLNDWNPGAIEVRPFARTFDRWR